MVARAKLKLARETERAGGADVAACLQALREGLGAEVVLTMDGVTVRYDDHRERRKSAQAILAHHRAVLKVCGVTDPAQITIDARTQELHVELTGPESTEDRRLYLREMLDGLPESDPGGSDA